MLQNRVVTALVLAPLTIAAILWLPADAFAWVWGLIILAGAYEWANLAGFEARSVRLALVAVLLAFLIGAWYFAADWAPGELPAWFYAPVVAWWAIWGVLFRRVPEKLIKVAYPSVTKLLGGGFVLASAWILLVWLRLNFGAQQVLYLVILIWVADAAAFFVGRNWGFTKLTPAISPGKTAEGVYGALFAAAALALGTAFIADLEGLLIVDFVFLSLLTVAFSVCGDLFESLAKRIRGVKDSGAILPGHGGVLDRIDSLTAGVSVFYAGSLLLGIFLQVGGPAEPTLILAPESPDAVEAPAVPGEPDHEETPQ